MHLSASTAWSEIRQRRSSSSSLYYKRQVIYDEKHMNSSSLANKGKEGSEKACSGISARFAAATPSGGSHGEHYCGNGAAHRHVGDITVDLS